MATPIEAASTDISDSTNAMETALTSPTKQLSQDISANEDEAEFKPFVRLPMELRLKIWKHGLDVTRPPRAILLHRTKTDGLATPAIAHTNHESRSVARKHLKRYNSNCYWLFPKSAHKSFYAYPNLDTFCWFDVNWGTTKGDPYFSLRRFSEFCVEEDVRHVEMGEHMRSYSPPSVPYSYDGGFGFWLRRVLGDVLALGRLESLPIVDDRIGIGKDGIVGFELIRKGKDDDQSTAFYEHYEERKERPEWKDYKDVYYAVAVPHFDTSKHKRREQWQCFFQCCWSGQWQRQHQHQLSFADTRRCNHFAGFLHVRLQ